MGFEWKELEVEREEKYGWWKTDQKRLNHMKMMTDDK